MPVRSELTPPGRRRIVLPALAAALLLAFLVLPGAAADRLSGSAGVTVADLPQAVDAGLADWLATGAAQPGSGLLAAVRLWAVFHGVKVLVTAALLVTLIVLAGRVGGAFARAESRRRRAGLAAAGAGLSSLALLALLVLMANVQGAVAPLSSALSLLPVAPPSMAVQQVREGLATGVATPPLDTLVGDFRHYHVALAVVASVAIVGMLATAMASWRRHARAYGPDHRLRRVLAAAGVALPVVAMLLGVVALANVLTAADPAPALAACFDGGA